MIKRHYSRVTTTRQKDMRILYIWLFSVEYRSRGRDFDLYVQNYGTCRGMDFYNDVHDWLGGYPYQSIAPKACRAMFARLGFLVERDFVIRMKFLHGLFGSGYDGYAFRRVLAL